MLLVCDIYYGMKRGFTLHFRHKKRGKIIVPPVVKLRHAKVVVSRQYPRKKPVSGMHLSHIASYAFGVFFSREDFLEKYRRCALLLLWSLTPLLWSFSGQVQAVVLVRN